YANDPGLVINTFWPGGPCCTYFGYWSSLLVTQGFREFRGHRIVTVTNPDLSTADHYFFQGDPEPEVGDTVCPTPSYGGDLGAFNSDPCFQPILRNSAL